jgi:hypothetical protein
MLGLKEKSKPSEHLETVQDEHEFSDSENSPSLRRSEGQQSEKKEEVQEVDSPHMSFAPQISEGSEAY